jgi:hypothetical protein
MKMREIRSGVLCATALDTDRSRDAITLKAFSNFDQSRKLKLHGNLHDKTVRSEILRDYLYIFHLLG